jgi:serine/threonine-protein kinase HipA
VAAVLDVFLYERKAGRLWLDDQRRFVFQYDSDWLLDTKAIPLSLALPLQEPPYEDDGARPFFANLLPEAGIRRAVAQNLGISEQNDFSMLEAIGGECAGAVSLLPEGRPLPATGDYRPLTEKKLHAIIQQLPQRPLCVGEEGIRLSLAGAQNKLPVYIHDDQVSLPLGINPSSHILKTSIRELEGSVVNEAFCMALAKEVGLPVPSTTIRKGKDTLYQIERYDRYRAKTGIIRIHQEDFCQALGVPPDQKYESEGGPKLVDCFSLVRANSVQPLPDINALLQWVIFNYLIANADAHGKNLSLLLPERGPKLAPFYDLMCTKIYEGLTDKLAMKIGGENRPDWIIARRWDAFADEVDIKRKEIRRRLRTMSTNVIEKASILSTVFCLSFNNVSVINDIVKVINARCNKVQAALDADEKHSQ